MNIEDQIKQLREERDDYRDQVSVLKDDVNHLKSRVSALEGMLEVQKTSGSEWQRQRDHYMRLATELMTSCNNAAATLSDAASRASHGEYRPNAVPTVKEDLRTHDPALTHQGVGRTPSMMDILRSLEKGE